MVRIQLRRDTATNWSATNPVLSSGEAGYDTTNKLLKIGDGATAWNNLASLPAPSEITELGNELNQLASTVTGLETSKQDTLTAGTGITIENNVISSTASGGGDYEDLANKPQINSVELDGNVSLSTLGLYSISEVDDKLINKQNIFSPENPLTIEEVTVTPYNNMTYSNGTGSVLAAPFRIYQYNINPFPNTSSVPSGAGDTTTGYRVTCSNVSAFGSSSSTSSSSPVTSGSNYAFVIYPFVVSGVETLFPINYQLGYFDNSGNFNFVTSCTLARTTTGTNRYRILSPLSEYGIVPSISYTTGICISEGITPSTFAHNIYYSITVSGNSVTTKWYDVNIDGGTISATEKDTYTLDNATIASLMNKVKAALYFPLNTDVDENGSIATINPILNTQYEPIFIGANEEPTVYSNLSLNLSASSGNTLEIKDDGLYAGSYTLPTASTTTLGGVKVDGTTITIADGVISAALEGYAQTSDIPTATSDLTNDSGFITNSVDNLTNYTLTSGLAAVATSGSYNDLTNKPTIPSEYVLPTASASVLGGVKIGDGVAVTDDGTISVASVDGFKFWSGTQTAYNGIATKDPNTLYIITGE